MARYAAFLRGVNVGAHRRVSNAELRELFEELGLADVSPFRTSGNVVFDGGRKSAASLTKAIEKGLEDALGHDIVVFLRTEDEVRAIAEHEPFDSGLVDASKGKLQVDLLGKPPTAGARKQVLALANDQDRLDFGDRELYWLPSGGTLESTLDLNAIAKLIGPTTRRTMGTMEQIAAKYFG
jgi:uncharacterized protein (DUF1697 family)